MLIRKEPDWTLIQSPVVVPKLFQLAKHYELVTQVHPESVLELADCIALVRPHGRRLLDKYLQDREGTRTALYSKPVDGRAYYKRSHAVAYSLVIVLQLHLIKAGVM